MRSIFSISIKCSEEMTYRTLHRGELLVGAYELPQHGHVAGLDADEAEVLLLQHEEQLRPDLVLHKLVYVVRVAHVPDPQADHWRRGRVRSGVTHVTHTSTQAHAQTHSSTQAQKRAHRYARPKHHFMRFKVQDSDARTIAR